jgi:hypothetical protein
MIGTKPAMAAVRRPVRPAEVRPPEDGEQLVKRSTWMLGFLSAILLVGLLSRPFEARAVTLYDNSPSPVLQQTNVGSQPAWQYQGLWGAFVATPVDSTHFLVAKHIYNNLTESPTNHLPDTFTFGGTNYAVDKSSIVKDPLGDLAILKITGGTFSTYAPLYTGASEVGKEITIFGKGRQPGAEVMVGSVLRGWAWGPAAATPSWGTNVVRRIEANGVAPFEEYLAFDFKPTQQTPHPAGLSEGDSSGGVFINDGGVWKLAGVNFGTDYDRYWSLTQDGAQFGANLVDGQGLYYEKALVISHDATTGYATRISSHVDWIRSVTVPEPASIAMLVGLVPLLVLAGLARRRSKQGPASEL